MISGHTKLEGNFDQLLDQLFVICSSNHIPGGSSSDMTTILTENSYFGALRSVLLGEKQKFETMAMEVSRSTVALMPSLQASNKITAEQCPLEQTLAECKTLCRESNNDAEVSGEVKGKMQKCLREYEHVGRLIDQNTNFCVQRAQQLFTMHATLRPIRTSDLHQFERVLQMCARGWKGELKDAVCNQLLLVKARASGQRKKRQNFSPATTGILYEYFVQNIDQPYPDDTIKLELAEKCGITLAQVSNWFGNKRIRFRKSQQMKASSSSAEVGGGGKKRDLSNKKKKNP